MADMSLTPCQLSSEITVTAVVGHGGRSSPPARRSGGGRPEPGAGRPTCDLARECADAWAAYAEAGSRAGHEPRLLARALLHAAAGDLRRLARSGDEAADAVVLAAARAFFLLRIAVRKGAYDPGMPGEVLPWLLLVRLLPTGWSDALELAAREARQARPASPRKVAF